MGLLSAPASELSKAEVMTCMQCSAQARPWTCSVGMPPSPLGPHSPSSRTAPTPQGEGRCRGDRDAFTREGDGGAQAPCHIPRRRLTGTRARGTGRGAPPAGSLASRSSTALCPAAGPAALSLSEDHKAGLGCQGRVQRTFQRWNKMSEEGQGVSLSVPGRGRGPVAKSSTSLWEPADSHRENERRLLPPPSLPGACADQQDPKPQPTAARRARHSQGGLAAWPAHQGLPGPGSAGQGGGGVPGGRSRSGQGGGMPCARDHGPEDLAQNQGEHGPCQAALTRGRSDFAVFWKLREVTDSRAIRKQGLHSTTFSL